MTRGTRLGAALAAVGLAAAAGLLASVGRGTHPAAEAAPPPGAERVHPAPDLATGLRRGVAYLVASQRKDGSWGSTGSNLWDIYAPAPGAYVAFRVASTGLAVSALLEAGAGEPGVEEAVRRGADHLLAHAAEARRCAPDTMYNVWAQAYSLEAFARLLAREKDAARTAALRAAAAVQVDYLGRFESVNGGWGYYDFEGQFQQPGLFTTTFTTATVLVALKDAAEQGVDVPRRIVDRGIAVVERLRKPDWTYAYSWDHLYWPQGGINKVKGSLARAVACDEALRRWGRDVPEARRVEALERLEELGHFLRIARKYPVPHETWYQNSGYFCFYGYFYAAELMESVPAAARAKAAAELTSRLLPLQEEDGSFWDYQLYGYHKAYGTAFVVRALSRCR